MGVVGKAGDWAFKAFSAGLGVATIFFAASFSLNVYRGLSWHNRQTEYVLTYCSFICLMMGDIGEARNFPRVFKFKKSGKISDKRGLRRKDLKSCSSRNDGFRRPTLYTSCC
ncbi:PREDICTED: uncharacterized protein LOC109227154 [Nicotiana attenuata]|uniref:uncharacterized protein LOC109227154 n=1 Tax=Nicotiana attenuata TaxID=49451 RepID=UPI0009052BD5|nr:PREDICTED: uncharacterized protein LOC109227154 [Nicotiana attenuata]